MGDRAEHPAGHGGGVHRATAQATEEQRRAVADIWLDNSGSAGALVEQARALWHERIAPFAHNLKLRRPAHRTPAVVAYDPSWPDQAGRIQARLNTACGHRAVRIDHIGSTAVPGMDAKDVIDVQVTVPSLEVADELADALQAAGTLLDSRQLEPAATARTVRTRGGRTQVTDGPFSETKEMLAGFNLIEADSEEDALRIAREFPWARTGSIEVRPVRDLARVRARVGA